MRYILGISAFYHDSAAALIGDGEILAAAQEERFTRKKNDETFPKNAVNFCLKHAGISLGDLEAVVFYDKPIVKFTRMLESYLSVAPGGWKTFPKILPTWLAEKLDLRKTIRDELTDLPKSVPVLFTEHHQSHAASAFFPSPFQRAAILTVDGVGEWASTTIGSGKDNEINLLKEIRFPHSLGLLYSAFTAYCGFRVNSGEYKLMGLAPYGEPVFADQIRSELIDLKSDGSFRLNMDYFQFLTQWTMTNDRFHQLFNGPPRAAESKLEKRHMDVARSIQVVTEEVMLRLARHAREVTGEENLCMAGGVALNCVANGVILREKIFKNIWIQPAAGDAGGALGAALMVYYEGQNKAQRPSPKAGVDSMKGSLLGPEFTDAEILNVLLGYNAVFTQLPDEQLFPAVARLLAEEKVIGWVQGRLEFGPRALGNRSIIGDPRSSKMQSVMNLKVKFRESFRPFAPAVLEERAAEFFDLDAPSPYMLLVAPVREELRNNRASRGEGLEQINELRSTIPAVTHVDYSARIQTVNGRDNPRFHRLLAAVDQLTGCPLLVNTSFNVRGEPVVCTPDDAYRCFINTEMDYLVLGNFLLKRSEQPHRKLERTFEALPD